MNNTSITNTQNSLVGAWEGEITITNHEGIVGFPTLFAFHAGGTTSETHPLFTPNNKLNFGPLQATPGQGIWREVSERQFEVVFVLLIQGAAGHETHEGQIIGTNRVTYIINLDDGGHKLTGQWKSCLKTPTGEIIVQGQGDYTATRVDFATTLNQPPAASIHGKNDHTPKEAVSA